MCPLFFSGQITSAFGDGERLRRHAPLHAVPSGCTCGTDAVPMRTGATTGLRRRIPLQRDAFAAHRDEIATLTQTVADAYGTIGSNHRRRVEVNSRSMAKASDVDGASRYMRSPRKWRGMCGDSDVAATMRRWSRVPISGATGGSPGSGGRVRRTPREPAVLARGAPTVGRYGPGSRAAGPQTQMGVPGKLAAMLAHERAHQRGACSILGQSPSAKSSGEAPVTRRGIVIASIAFPTALCRRSMWRPN
jgi:hypothetical protein